jgi:hypothetical protein
MGHSRGNWFGEESGQTLENRMVERVQNGGMTGDEGSFVFVGAREKQR